MKTFLAIAIPAAGVLAAFGALSTGLGTALVMLVVAAAATFKFALR